MCGSARFRGLVIAAGTLFFCAAAPIGETVVETEITARERLNLPQIWGFEFAYKSPRMMVVDVPDQTGTPHRKLVWYLPYRVTNRNDEEKMFVPELILETDTGQRYPDKVVPIALEAISVREDFRKKWKDSASIAGVVPPSPEEGASRSVYGIATWYDVDSKTDHFSIFVNGLSNGYKIEKNDNGEQRTLKKTLELKFWRPGDEFFENEKEIQFVGSNWLYR